MIPTTGWVLSGGVLALLLWFAAGLLGDVRDRMSARFGRWMLPETQPASYRIAFGIATIAKWIAPGERVIIEWSGVVTNETGSKPAARADIKFTDRESASWDAFLPNLLRFSSSVAGVAHIIDDREMVLRLSLPRLQRTRWESPQAAVAELEADLFTGRQLESPVSLVLPLLRYAIRLRYSNAEQRVKLGLIRVGSVLGLSRIPTGVIARYPRESDAPVATEGDIAAVIAMWEGDMAAMYGWVEAKAIAEVRGGSPNDYMSADELTAQFNRLNPDRRRPDAVVWGEGTLRQLD